MNYLALLELILKKEPNAGGEITHALEKVASYVGISEYDQEIALGADRMLVIYEP